MKRRGPQHLPAFARESATALLPLAWNLNRLASLMFSNLRTATPLLLSPTNCDGRPGIQCQNRPCRAKKASAESQKGAAPEREFGVAFTFGGFELFLREVSNHSLPLGS